MNFTLFKMFIKKNWGIWLGVLLFILIEMAFCILLMDIMDDAMGEMYPLGITGDSALQFTASLVFTSHVYIFPMILFIVLAIKLMSSPVNNTSMSTYLSSSLKRREYTVTAGAFIAFCLIAMFLVIFLAGAGMLLNWGSFNWAHWLNLNVSALTVNFAVAFLCFFFSTVFIPNKWGTLLTIALPILFMLFYMLSANFDFLQYTTPYAWIDPAKIAAGAFKLWFVWDIIFLGVTSVLFFISVKVFDRKQLSI